VPGEGGLITFADSSWLTSIVLPHQPHFIGQPEDVNVFDFGILKWPTSAVMGWSAAFTQPTSS
jgi:myosin-crossreactive antigen